MDNKWRQLCLACILVTVPIVSLTSLSLMVILLWQCHSTSCIDQETLNLEISSVVIIGGAYLVIVPSIIYRCVTRRRSQQLRCARPKTFQLDLVESGNSETQLRTEAKESATLVMPTRPPPSYVAVSDIPCCSGNINGDRN